MNSNMLELSVTVRNREGRYTKIKEFGHNGLTYIEGREGQNFAIHFRNNTARRVLAVPSVDGLSALDGEAATPDSRGYIVEPYSSVEVKGWRTSLDDLSLFVFKKKDGSYSAQVGEGTANCGVIAVKVYAEKEKPAPRPSKIIIREEHHHHHDHYPHWPTPVWPRRPYEPYWGPTYTCGTPGEMMRSVGDSSANASLDSGVMKCAHPVSATSFSVGAQQLSNDAPEFSLGAGFGEHLKDTVTEAAFERAAEITTLALYFTDAASLEKIGISLKKDVAVSAPVLPQAFRAGFCKAPKTA